MNNYRVTGANFFRLEIIWLEFFPSLYAAMEMGLVTCNHDSGEARVEKSKSWIYFFFIYSSTT
jgi:hypothetical protein